MHSPLNLLLQGHGAGGDGAAAGDGSGTGAGAAGDHAALTASIGADLDNLKATMDQMAAQVWVCVTPYLHPPPHLLPLHLT